MNSPLPAAVNRTAIEPLTVLRGWRERLLATWLNKLAIGQLHVSFPSGATMTFQAPQQGPAASIVIDDLTLIYRLLVSGDLGFAESFIAGEWKTPDLKALLMLGTLNEKVLSSALAESWWSRLLGRVIHACHSNTKYGSRKNIAAHYDLGNDFYAAWLDETMSYSAALFSDFREGHEIAQLRKYHRLARKLDIQKGERVLEIGCGWGGFAEIAARDYGCHVVGLTLSREQAAFARGRIENANLSDRVDIRLQDYRDVTGRFDHIVSIEMFEAVGEAYWSTYMAALKKLLKPGGQAALQIITIADDAFTKYRSNPDFIQRYIFPGGMLPNPERLLKEVESAGLTLADSWYFGTSYAESLRRWEQAFQSKWDSIKTIGFDEAFRRMWLYYLAYCEAGFDAGRIDVGQFVLKNP